MQKIDLKKQLSHLYGTTTRQGFVMVDVPEMRFLMADGQGNPNSSTAFSQAVEALYALSYTLKFASKTGPLQRDYGVMPLEGLWWADDMDDFLAGNKDTWKWTVMILQPDWVTPDMVDEARQAVAKKKKDLPALTDIRFETHAEGPSAQCLYTGPYADETQTIAALHGFIAAEGLRRRGKHHEIYLSDARRTAPEKLRTILRQPVSAP